ncbi:TetR/AcrR family transcriptional regulator [Mycobacterium malmoense]|uniref:TetR family transcriptional regulator n=1 Tax=Mycobacterium malmoense TaxID=1780 RepID=A0ABX3SPD1_MYCMA|nr:TetR/AcrR family transcriptional regulator [Mycobacterium malmoense]OIN79959.1 TetR family transcriptional regulator [Mycobacterium malmoense]ORA79974.1 TetR family transcriptional regulator [Mycobacterium malmoense]QZA19987.1 TetR/AcrR family transcriptional regulator [Mycobacterium malmoense]
MAAGQAEAASHKERLLLAGMKLFYEQGFHGTTVDAVLVRAGVPKGSFYHHFGSKDAFGQAVLDRYLQFQLEALEKWANKEDVSTPDKVVGHFDDMVRLFVKSGYQRGCLTGKFSTEVAATSDLFRDQLGRQIAKWKAGLVELLKRGQRAGDIRQDQSAQDIADGVLALIQGAFVVALSTRDKRTLAAIANTIRKVVEP